MNINLDSSILEDLQSERLVAIDNVRKYKLAYERAMSSLEQIAGDKWARTQVMKYCEATVGEVVDCAIKQAKEFL